MPTGGYRVADTARFGADGYERRGQCDHHRERFGDDHRDVGTPGFGGDRECREGRDDRAGE